MPCDPALYRRSSHAFKSFSTSWAKSLTWLNGSAASITKHICFSCLYLYTTVSLRVFQAKGMVMAGRKHFRLHGRNSSTWVKDCFQKTIHLAFAVVAEAYCQSFSLSTTFCHVKRQHIYGTSIIART